ncbi:unnamed protein product [Prunus armeniaca]
MFYSTIECSQFSCSQTYTHGSGYSTHLEMCNGSIEIKLGAEESLIDLKDLAAKIRKGSEQETCQELKDYYRDLMDNEDIDKYNCTSWCRFTFYETDFGWGKPAWVSFASFPIKNVIVLMDKRYSNGIETWLTISKACMALFKSNSELLAYASANPSVTW